MYPCLTRIKWNRFSLDLKLTELIYIYFNAERKRYSCLDLRNCPEDAGLRTVKPFGCFPCPRYVHYIVQSLLLIYCISILADQQISLFPCISLSYIFFIVKIVTLRMACAAGRQNEWNGFVAKEILPAEKVSSKHRKIKQIYMQYLASQHDKFKITGNNLPSFFHRIKWLLKKIHNGGVCFSSKYHSSMNLDPIAA